MPVEKAVVESLSMEQSEMPESRRMRDTGAGFSAAVCCSHLALLMHKLFNATFSAYTPCDMSKASCAREGRLCLGVVA